LRGCMREWREEVDTKKEALKELIKGCNKRLIRIAFKYILYLNKD
jgi:ribosomal protein S20